MKGFSSNAKREGVGSDGLEIKEDGVWEASTTKGVQNLINRVTHADEFIEAAKIYKCLPFF